mgnify:FL=1
MKDESQLQKHAISIELASKFKWILEELVSPINVILEFKNPTNVGFFYTLNLKYGEYDTSHYYGSFSRSSYRFRDL